MVVYGNSAIDGRALGEALAVSYLAHTPAPNEWRQRVRGIDMAYAAQDAMVEVFTAYGKGAVAGYKVGLTSKAMQALCGIEMPICGRILAENIYSGDVELHRDRYVHLGVESELAFRLACDIDHPLEGSDEQMLGVIDSVHAAFEVVDDRGADYARLSAAEIVAENSWNVGIVLGDGAPTRAVEAIDRIHGRYSENGREVGQGSSADVLGNPLNVLRWLSRFLLERGSMLRAGDIVMTGSIVPTRFPAEGTTCQFVLDGLAPVTLRIAEA